jgi:hypothetical protein
VLEPPLPPPQGLALVHIYTRVLEFNKAIEVLLAQKQSKSVLQQLWTLLLLQEDVGRLKWVMGDYLQMKAAASLLSLKNMASYAWDLFQYGRVLRVSGDFRAAYTYL